MYNVADPAPVVNRPSAPRKRVPSICGEAYRGPVLTTRVGGPADAPATARLWTVASIARQAHLGLPLGPVAGAASVQTAEDRVHRLLGGPGAVLVLGFAPDTGSGGEPVAMALVVQARAEDGASTEPLPGVCHVSMVAVHPDHWGRHLGALVMARAQLEASHAGYTRAQLWTHETNHRAQRLYERLDWIPSGRTTTDDHGEQIRHYTREL
jgi:ribosomal protein S18 acetylase RimI-like enzyme